MNKWMKEYYMHMRCKKKKEKAPDIKDYIVWYDDWGKFMYICDHKKE